MYRMLHLTVALIALGGPVAALTVTDDTPRSVGTSALPTLWVGAIADTEGEGFTHACVPLAVKGNATAFNSCAYEGGLVDANPKADFVAWGGKEKGGLLLGETYFIPQPVATTPAERAVVDRAAAAIAAAPTVEARDALISEIAAARGNFDTLAERLDAFEERLVTIEEVNATQTNKLTTLETSDGEQNTQLNNLSSELGTLTGQIDTVSGNLDPILKEIGDDSTLTKFVDGRIATAVPETSPQRTNDEINDLINQNLVNNQLLIENENGKLVPVDSGTQPPVADNSIPWWYWLVGLLILAVLVWLIWRKRKKYATQDDFNSLKGKVEDKESGLVAVHATAGEAYKLADRAHKLAGQASQEARVATNLNLPDGWTLIGDLPSNADLENLDDGDAVTLRFRHEDKGERKAVFTKASGVIKNAEGNMVAGLYVTGITGLTKPIALRVTNMIGKVRNGIKSNHFVGVDDKGQTLTTPKAA